MTISGFTFVRNATKYYFPIKESILSILPIVDEFVIALGNNDADDLTRQELESIDSDKIKIIDRIWDESDFEAGNIFAKETSFALEQCTGDWCFYLQADEVVHEQDLSTILQACEDRLHDASIDGFLFKYYHFFGDYEHYLPYHGWYRNEIRIVRNHIGVYSYKDAQSFRKGNDEKLNVLPIEAHIYHYGWVRPPHLMQSKKREMDTYYHDTQSIHQEYNKRPEDYEYGALGNIPIFPGTHPEVMSDFREKIYWTDALNYGKKATLNRAKMKHEKLKYRMLTKIENLFNGGKDIMGYSNWNIVK